MRTHLLRRTGGRDERGVAIVLFALVLTALLTMSAIAVDLGSAYAERRHDQNTADAAVMSGAIEAVHGGGEIDQVVEEVIKKVDITLGRTVSIEEWESCRDPDALELTTIDLQSANPTVDPATECISFNAGFDRVRVKLPPQEAMGVFGKMVGFDPIKTSAAAVAQIEASPGGGAPPFIAFENAKKGDFVCLRTGGAQDDEPENLMDGKGPGFSPTESAVLDPCHSANYPVSSSTFGTVKPYAYRDGCASPGNHEIKRAIAVGMDHLLGIFPGGFDTVPDPAVPGSPGDPAAGAVAGDGVDSRQRVDGGDGCKVAYPNTLQVDIGLSAQDLKCALFSPHNSDLCENEFPRLKQGAGHQSTYRVVNETFDNTAAWDFLRNASVLHDEGAPPSCVLVAAASQDDATVEAFDLTDPAHDEAYDAFVEAYPDWQDEHWDPYDLFDTFQDCLNDWQPGKDATGVPHDPELFIQAIGDYPRFAFIPQVAEATLTGPGQLVHVEGFLPVYLYRVHIPTSGNPVARTMCGPYDSRVSQRYLVHDAGQPWSCGHGNDNIARLASLVFACGMVPDSLCDKDSKLPQTSGGDVYEFRLVE